MKTKRAGFTLLELLVIIAILALLMSILIPALRIAKKKAQNVVCISNLHQCLVMVMGYASEHDHYFPGYGINAPPMFNWEANGIRDLARSYIGDDPRVLYSPFFLKNNRRAERGFQPPDDGSGHTNHEWEYWWHANEWSTTPEFTDTPNGFRAIGYNYHNIPYMDPKDPLYTWTRNARNYRPKKSTDSSLLVLFADRNNRLEKDWDQSWALSHFDFRENNSEGRHAGYIGGQVDWKPFEEMEMNL